jgi:PTS system nitrogen regulatory IIA component
VIGAGADHLKALSRITRLLRNPSLTAKLRAAADAESLFAILSESQASSNAA